MYIITCIYIMYIYIFSVRIGDCLSDYVLVLGCEVDTSAMTSRGWRLLHGNSLFWRCSGS